MKTWYKPRHYKKTSVKEDLIMNKTKSARMMVAEWAIYRRISDELHS